MSRYRRANIAGATYFFSVVTYRRQIILCDTPVRKVLREAIQTVREVRPFTIDAWVLLPDHLHCIWILPPGDNDFSARWAMIKRKVSLESGALYKRHDWLTPSKRKRRESTLWQRRYWEHQIRNAADYQRHVDYIHWNPVKHGHVKCVADWPYSTFHRYVGRGMYPVGWGGVELESDADMFGE